jgi:hypothetical protein
MGLPAMFMAPDAFKATHCNGSGLQTAKEMTIE